MSVVDPIKRPLNALDNPVYADIRNKPPRFYKTRPFWQVDVGKTQQQIEFDVDRLDYAILAQPRDYSERIYGKSSHKDVVNKAFRPPLLTQEDLLPLNRIPRGLTVPHTNPYTSWYHMMPEDTQLLTRFTTTTDQEHYTTTKVRHGYAPPTFYRPIHTGGGVGGVVSDFKVKLKVPQTSVATLVSLPGLTSPVQDGAENGMIRVKLANPLNYSASAGVDFPTYDTNLAAAPVNEKTLRLDGIAYTSRIATPTFTPVGGSREGFTQLDQVQEIRPLTSFTTNPALQLEINTRTPTEIDLITKTDLNSSPWRLNVNLPPQAVEPAGRRTISMGTRMQKDTPTAKKTLLEPHKNPARTAGITHKTPKLRSKGASGMSTHLSHTQGFIPQSGITIGGTGRGL
jgi:hypothetical protein